jgi:hypothetical protein
MATTSKIYNASNMSTSDVKKMQQALVNAGYDVGKSGVDGIWGKDTEKALSAYKAATGGSNTYGTTIGNETFRKLYGSTSGSSSNKSGTSSGTTKTTNTNTADDESGDYQLGGGLAYTYSQEEIEEQAAQAAQEEAAALYQEQMQNALSNLQNTYDINASQLANIYNQQKQAANESADDAAREQYILYKQNKNNLGEQLSTQGITGGASETALNSILNAYTSGLATNEKARQNSLTELGNTYQNDLTNLQAQLSSDQASINQQYGQAIAEAAAAAKEKYVAEMEEANAASELANANMYAESQITSTNPKYIWTDSNGYLNYSNNASDASIAKASGYNVATNSAVSDSVAKWNASVAKKIQQVNPKYTWTDSDGKLHWSNNQSTANIAKASGYKVTTRTDEKTTSSSSSSNSSKKKVTSTTTTSKDTSSKSTDDPFKSTKTTTSNNDKNSNYDYVLKMTKVLTATPATYTQAVNYVKGTGLTTKQKEKILKAVGLL